MKNEKEETKKMNPLWVVLVFIVLIITVLCKITIAAKGNEYKLEAIYQEFNSDVDSGTQALLNHSGFKVLSQSEKVAQMGKLLAIYEQTGAISNLYYVGDSYMYTFTYNTEPIAGALGGVSLKEWNPYMN
jgi:hypothetical protein